jgi:hypothetical protein
LHFCVYLRWHFVLIHREGCTNIVCTVCKKQAFCNPGNSVGLPLFFVSLAKGRRLYSCNCGLFGFDVNLLLYNFVM